MLILAALLAGCGRVPADTALTENGPVPEVTPAAPALRRLTQEQYANAARDLLGEDIVLPTSLEPDSVEDGLLSVGAAVTSVSSYGVERYEDAAYLLAEQVVSEPERWAAVVPCEPAGPSDADCAAQWLTGFGRRAWRRPLSEEELGALTALVTGIGGEAGAFEEGALYALAALLQSPNFLYRREHGEAGEGGDRALTDYELAGRLSFLLWNTIPDEALLDAAAEGRLGTDEGLRLEAERLLADERARGGVRSLFNELFTLYELDDISKDPTVFTHASEELGPAAREETLRTIETLVFDARGDFRELLTTQSTWVDPRLAALYSIPAPSMDGFGETWLEESEGRRGLLGQASFLMLGAHATRTSATLRGKFIREVLLCQVIPQPPADVDTSIPEADADAPTLRDRIASHLEDPSCASCHQITDPIGLGLENFDGVGRWRDTENGVTIDASGDLDGAAFADAWELAGVVAEHDSFTPCMTEHLYAYAVGHSPEEGEEALVDWLHTELALSGYDWQELLLATVMSPGFRQVGELD